jgi:uncharacterized protein YyaL (SSP411 family)
MNEYQFTNELINESSPYLLEHAHNPVNWFPWGNKALEKAKNENKPLIISIGYSSCHWCHIMERESYSDTAVANYMNKYFVAIKVDREERPDIDHIYMNAVMLLSGSGGWPLNAFALPNGKPFYATTYLPKSNWLDLLKQVEHLYHTQNEKLVSQAKNITNGINQTEIELKYAHTIHNFEIKNYINIFDKWQPAIDYQNGGFNGAPKFPLPVGWEFLLQYNYITKNEKALEAVTSMLNNIAMGGIYDQIGGGFARYSTDRFWKVPHFEKMLYDNGQLISLYSHAFQVTKNTLYKAIIVETLNFINRELTNSNGGFYSSLNADSEGEEGKFYVWTYNEITEILGIENAKIISAYYQVTPSGNWGHEKNILYVKETKESFTHKYGISENDFDNILIDSKEKLLKARNKRIRPSTDDKILTSWNALMLKGYIDAYKALGDENYINIAIKNATFLENNMIKGSTLLRNFKDGKANIVGFLDDYALLAQSYIELYQVTFNIHWLMLAKKLTDYSISHFYDKNSGMFFYTSNQTESLIARKFEIPDNVIPSSNSVLAMNLFLLGEYFDNNKYTTLSKTMLQCLLNELYTGGTYYANWASLLGIFTVHPYEIGIMGKDALQKNLQMQQHYLPTAIFMGGNDENLPLLENKKISGITRIYVCKNKTCILPVEDVNVALNFLKGN